MNHGPLSSSIAGILIADTGVQLDTIFLRLLALVDLPVVIADAPTGTMVGLLSVSSHCKIKVYHLCMMCTFMAPKYMPIRCTRVYVDTDIGAAGALLQQVIGESVVLIFAPHIAVRDEAIVAVVAGVAIQGLGH